MRANATGVSIGTTSGSYYLNVSSSSAEAQATFLSQGANNVVVDLNDVGGGNIVALRYLDINSEKWELTKGFGNQFYLYDASGSKFFINAVTGGNLTLGAAQSFNISQSGNTGIGSSAPVVSFDLSQKTDALSLPVGTTGTRPTGANGEIRYNTSTSAIEAFVSGAWVPLTGPGSAIYSSGRLLCGGTNCANTTGSTTLNYCPLGGNLKTTVLYGNYTIPSGCLTASLTSMYIGGTSAQAAAASTLYYVYLINVSGTTYLDLETTGHATDSATGIEIMSGNNAKTLVGMIHTNSTKTIMTKGQTNTAGDTNTVATWDNRIPTTTHCGFTSTHQINTSSYVVIGAENSCLFMSWGDAAQFASAQTAYTGSSAQILINTYINLDGSSTVLPSTLSVLAPYEPGGAYTPAVLAVAPASYTPTEGYHYTQMLGSGTTGTALNYTGGPYTTVFTIQ